MKPRPMVLIAPGLALARRNAAVHANAYAVPRQMIGVFKIACSTPMRASQPLLNGNLQIVCDPHRRPEPPFRCSPRALFRRQP
jgi:hypothetical protein